MDAEGDGEEDGEGGGDVVHDDVSGAPCWSPALGPWCAGKAAPHYMLLYRRAWDHSDQM